MDLEINLFEVRTNINKNKEKKGDKILMLHMLRLQEAFQFYMFALELQCKIYLLLCMGHNQMKNTLLMANPYVERLGGRLTYT